MQGIVLEIDLKSDSGIVRGDDGVRREFKMQSCRNGVPLEGARVDFETKEENVAEIYILSTPLKAKLDWFFWFLFSFRGRISRDQLIMFLVGGVLLSALLSALSQSVLFFGVGFLTMYVCAAVIIKRFHDSGSSAFWPVFTVALSVFVALIQGGVLNLFGQTFIYILIAFLALAVVFCLYLCFARGTIGKNRYGEEPYFCRTIRLK